MVREREKYETVNPSIHPSMKLLKYHILESPEHEFSIMISQHFTIAVYPMDIEEFTAQIYN